MNRYPLMTRKCMLHALAMFLFAGHALAAPLDSTGEQPNTASLAGGQARSASSAEPSRLSRPTGFQPVVSLADRRDALSSLTGGTARLSSPNAPVLQSAAQPVEPDSGEDHAVPIPRTTVLVPLPQDPSWQDMAFLAAVPAATVANGGAPSLIALDATGEITPEIRDYANRYKPDQVILLGGAQGATEVAGKTCKRIDAASADEAACKLSAMFWGDHKTAVICPEFDYESAVVASALAARLNTPLLFAGPQQVSDATNREIQRHFVGELIVVGNCAKQVRAMKPAPKTITELSGAKDVMAWVKERHLPVKYLTALNPLDRYHTVIRKLSLAGVVLAAGREGLVAPLAFDTQWKIPFSGTAMKGDLPADLPKSEAPPKTGKVTVDGLTKSFLLTGQPNDRDLHVYFDLNGDGVYQGNGEGPFATGDTLELAGKHYVITLGTKNGPGTADVRLTWPSAEELITVLRGYYTALGGAPEYLCLCGFPDAIPQAIRGNLGVVPEVTTDLPYTNADDDPFAEICVARVIAENASFATLYASRALTYGSLLTPDWQDRACLAQWENTSGKLLENAGFDASYRHSADDLKWELPPSDGKKGKRVSTFSQDSPLTRCAVITHMDHSWWHELGSTFGWDADVLLAPVVVESGGCLTAALDREPDFRSVIARLLRKGAVAFVGNAREGCAPQELQRMEFWTGVLAGQTIGQAHRQSINSAITTILDKGKGHAMDYDYQVHIRTLFGDPAFRMRVPCPLRSAPARTSVDGDKITVHAPATWWPVKMLVPGDWKQWTGKDLYVLRGAGTYALRQWCSEQYDREETCVTAEFTTRRQVARIEQLQKPPAPLGINGTWHADRNADGSSTYRWVVRLADFDQKKGIMINSVDQLDYQVIWQ